MKSEELQSDSPFEFLKSGNTVKIHGAGLGKMNTSLAVLRLTGLLDVLLYAPGSPAPQQDELRKTITAYKRWK